MYKRITLAIILSVVSLGGCDSFTLSYTHEGKHDPHTEAPANTNPASGVVQTNPLETQASVIQKLTEIQQAQKGAQDKMAQNWCPRYRPPIVEPAPKAPLETLNGLRPSDTEAIAALTRNYIVALNQWISTSQAIQAKAYRDYILQCQQARKQVPPNM